MTNPTGTDPSASPPMLDEADIGSGEKTPAQKETEEMIRQIPPLQSDQQNSQQSGEPPDQPAITSPS
ncbi:MAG: hypothetical protein JWP59_1460 [Massilia sp.]|jgi:hypothetical protein|nr:hypothetical protein [Massilia sp.]